MIKRILFTLAFITFLSSCISDDNSITSMVSFGNTVKDDSLYVVGQIDFADIRLVQTEAAHGYASNNMAYLYFTPKGESLGKKMMGITYPMYYNPDETIVVRAVLMGNYFVAEVPKPDEGTYYLSSIRVNGGTTTDGRSFVYHVGPEEEKHRSEIKVTDKDQFVYIGNISIESTENFEDDGKVEIIVYDEFKKHIIPYFSNYLLDADGENVLATAKILESYKAELMIYVF